MGAEVRAVALVSKYGPPNDSLLEASSGAVYACRPLTTTDRLEVISVQDIISCVAMVQCPSLLHSGPGDGPVLFVVDKLGTSWGSDYTDESEGDGGFLENA